MRKKSAIKSVSRYLEKKISCFVEEASIICHVGLFIGVVIFFGIIYYILTPFGHGIGQNTDTCLDTTILTGIYFSTVTISSLGYGDMHPVGFSKVLACIEVLLGLALIGIMIAKVTSRSLSDRVESLFVSDAQRRLEDIATKFDASRDQLDEIMLELANAYQATLGQTPIEDNDGLLSDFRGIISVSQSNCVALRSYFSIETKRGNYFQSVPAEALERVGNAVNDAFLILVRCIETLSSQEIDEIRRNLKAVIDVQKQVCTLINEHATAPDTLKGVFQDIETNCNLLEECLAVPEDAVMEESQPNQIPQGTDELQKPSEVDNE